MVFLLLSASVCPFFPISYPFFVFICAQQIVSLRLEFSFFLFWSGNTQYMLMFNSSSA